MKKFFKLLLYILPLLLGILGFHYLEREPFLDSVFNSILMYILCYTEHPANIFIEVARWLAPAMTASWVLIIFHTLREQLMHFLMFCTGKSIAVYGPAEEKETLLQEIKNSGIDGKKHFVRANKYILLDDESKNFEFYNLNQKKMLDSSVFMRCESIPSEAINESNLHLFCSEETSARLFWKEHFLYPLSRQKNHQLEIVFLGFDKLGEELLLFGLQNNIFSPTQNISYHIFGDGTRFQATHTELASISDPIYFYSEPWYLHLDLLEKAEMVIILTQEKQTELLRSLLFATTVKDFHVFAANTSVIRLLAEYERLHVFDWKNESQKLEYILNDTLFEHAKQINLRYAHLYKQVPENKVSMEKEWQILDTFTRYSNVSAADYQVVRQKMLAYDGQADSDILSPDILETHAELEHIRWCRYHYLNNWKYGIPANGKNKDQSLRIHKDLIPYCQLTDNEKEKDRENIRILHSI